MKFRAERDALLEAITTAGRAAATRGTALPALTGVRLEVTGDQLHLAGTDLDVTIQVQMPVASGEAGVCVIPARLAVRHLPGTSVRQEGQTVLVPSRALAELNRVVSAADQVTLRLASDEASFEVGETRLTTRLIEGDFPNYRQLIPQSYPNRLIVGKEPFLNAIRRVKLLAKDATPVRLTLRPDGLELVAVTQDVGQAREDLEAKYEGTEMVVAFNPEFLIDGVEAITGDEVQLDTLDALKPATVRSTENPNFLYLLMPVRVS